MKLFTQTMLAIVLSSILLTSCSQEPESLEISCADAQTAIEEGAYLIDVRTPQENAAEKLTNGTLIPLDNLESIKTTTIPQSSEIIAYCRSGNRSAQAQKLLTEYGYTKVKTLKGGITSCKF